MTRSTRVVGWLIERRKKMEKRKAKRISMVVGMVTLMFVFFSSQAFPWGFATHAYINDQLGKRRGLNNAKEIYGGMVPDVFNYLFDYPEYMAFLTEETHGNFMKVWDSARWGFQKPLAYGFVSHSIADLRTHDQTNGYAMVKAAEILSMQLPPQLEGPINELNGLVGDEILIEMLHIIVENAVDTLIIRNDDPLIGRKITSAAILRSHQVPRLLVRAYASDFAAAFGINPLEASKFIVSAEKEFRKSIISYGQILVQDEPTAIRLISEQTADAAVAYLGLYGIDISGLFQDEEDLIQLILALTDVAISICGDYRSEIGATIGCVDDWLEANDVSY
jgi:hypothetical protein